MNSENTSKAFTSQQTRPKVTPPPSYGEIANSSTNIFKCDICLLLHATNEICTSKPPYPPDTYFKKCNICLGHHPRGQCYFENLREVLNTYSECQRCQIHHIGFCYAELLCPKCNKQHNTSDECTRYTHKDLSNNLCPECNSFHTNHCYEQLCFIESGLILWCNRCKVEHQFLKCVPFCDKCQRRHQVTPVCPDLNDYCNTCQYSHHGRLCPKAFQRPGEPRVIPDCAPDCDACCKHVHFRERKNQQRQHSSPIHIYDNINDAEIDTAGPEQQNNISKPSGNLRKHQLLLQVRAQTPHRRKIKENLPSIQKLPPN